MKGIIRRSGAFILCAALILTLCSCDWLDDKKAGHAVWKTGKHETILFDDTEYRLLEIKGNKTPIMPYSHIRGYENENYVTEDDVPVLAADMYGTRFRLSSDKSLIKVGDKYYARKNKYDDYAAAAKKTITDRYGFYYGSSSPKLMRDIPIMNGIETTVADGDAGFAVLSSKFSEMIDDIKVNPMEKQIASRFQESSFNYCMQFVACDRNGMMCAGKAYTLLSDGYTYCLRREDKGDTPVYYYMFSDDTEYITDLYETLALQGAWLPEVY